MKKLVIVLCVIMSLTLFACGSNQTQPNTKNASESQISCSDAWNEFEKRDFDPERVSADVLNNGKYNPISTLNQDDSICYAEYSLWYTTPNGVVWLIDLVDGKMKAIPFSEEIGEEVIFTEEDLVVNYNPEDNTYTTTNIDTVDNASITNIGEINVTNINKISLEKMEDSEE